MTYNSALHTVCLVYVINLLPTASLNISSQSTLTLFVIFSSCVLLLLCMCVEKESLRVTGCVLLAVCFCGGNLLEVRLCFLLLCYLAFCLAKANTAFLTAPCFLYLTGFGSSRERANQQEDTGILNRNDDSFELSS